MFESGDLTFALVTPKGHNECPFALLNILKCSRLDWKTTKSNIFKEQNISYLEVKSYILTYPDPKYATNYGRFVLP